MKIVWRDNIENVWSNGEPCFGGAFDGARWAVFDCGILIDYSNNPDKHVVFIPMERGELAEIASKQLEYELNEKKRQDERCESCHYFLSSALSDPCIDCSDHNCWELDRTGRLMRKEGGRA